MKSLLKTFSTLCLSAAVATASLPAHATPVWFPLVGITGSANNRDITVIPDTATNVLTYGGNLVSLQTLLIHPIRGNATNELLPWGYTMRIDGWPRSAHFVVPMTTNVVNVTTLITNALAIGFPASSSPTIGYFVTNTFYVFSNAGTSVVNGNYYPIGSGQFGNGTCFFSTNGLPTAVVMKISDGTQYYATTNGLFGTWGNYWYSGGTPVGTSGAAPPPLVSVGQTLQLVLNYPLVNVVGTNVDFSGSFSGNMQGTFTGDISPATNANATTIFGSGVIPAIYLPTFPNQLSLTPAQLAGLISSNQVAVTNGILVDGRAPGVPVFDSVTGGNDPAYSPNITYAWHLTAPFTGTCVNEYFSASNPGTNVTGFLEQNCDGRTSDYCGGNAPGFDGQGIYHSWTNYIGLMVVSPYGSSKIVWFTNAYHNVWY